MDFGVSQKLQFESDCANLFENGEGSKELSFHLVRLVCSNQLLSIFTEFDEGELADVKFDKAPLAIGFAAS